MSVYKQGPQSQFPVIDILIIGAGPAGLASAITLGKLGYRTKLVDKSPNLPLRVGECLPAKGASSLKPLGLESAFLNDQHIPLQGYDIKWGDATYEKHLIHSSHGTGWLLDRKKFDTMLTKAATKNDCDIQFDTRLSNLKRDQTSHSQWQASVRKGQEEQTFRVKAIIDASGRARVAARRLDISQARSDTLVASVCHLQHQTNSKAPPYTVQITTDTNGWWYSAPINKATSVLIYFTDSDLPLPTSAQEQLSFAQRLGEFKTRLGQGQITVLESSFKRVAAYSSALSRCTGEAWVAVGDAACSYDPLSSYGITSALGSGYYGALALHETLSGQTESLDSYQQLMQHTFMTFLDKQQQEYQAVCQYPSLFWQRRNSTVRFKPTKQ